MSTSGTSGREHSPLPVAGLALPCLLSSMSCPGQWISQNSSCNSSSSCLSSGLSLLPCPSLACAGIFPGAARGDPAPLHGCWVIQGSVKRRITLTELHKAWQG